ncbi:MAG: N-acetyl-gamma-glutamyl-phosphate reductase [Chloroflexi bacterium]|nr:N-acetyl-gamma-glutamyl-phosphate reductase [Chloroflexota bacterium]OJW05316.1 MAG: N-acetyl-gamma-glutamyl-phosphate reductase [Chloroflexi bacterium 54-19]
MKVSIVGITGYVGAELARLLGRRPDVELLEVVGRSAAGQPIGKVFPNLAPLKLTVAGELERMTEADVIFLALPHHASAETAAEILEKSPTTKVIDMSADFRLKDRATYEKWYGPHPAAYLLLEAVYGLPELYRDQINPQTRLIANPGCYPTCSTLGLAPALSSKLGKPFIEPDVIVDALSGTSGAGRGLKQNLHFSEMTESTAAYGLEGHRHLPEIAQTLTDVYGSPVDVIFTPHLVPLSRGMLATSYARLTDDFVATYKTQAEATQAVRQYYRDFYANDPFVVIVDESPYTKQVAGSNYIYICPTINLSSRRLVVVSALDNLTKGAGGEGVQNMNLLMGLPETTGLDMLGLYP